MGAAAEYHLRRRLLVGGVGVGSEFYAARARSSRAFLSHPAIVPLVVGGVVVGYDEVGVRTRGAGTRGWRVVACAAADACTATDACTAVSAAYQERHAEAAIA